MRETGVRKIQEWDIFNYICSFNSRSLCTGNSSTENASTVNTSTGDTCMENSYSDMFNKLHFSWAASITENVNERSLKTGA